MSTWWERNCFLVLRIAPTTLRITLNDFDIDITKWIMLYCVCLCRLSTSVYILCVPLCNPLTNVTLPSLNEHPHTQTHTYSQSHACTHTLTHNICPIGRCHPNDYSCWARISSQGRPRSQHRRTKVSSGNSFLLLLASPLFFSAGVLSLLLF